MKNFGPPAESASLLFWITQRRSFMPGRCSLLSSCSTGVMPCEASMDTSPVRHTFLKLAAASSWRLWTYDSQVWMSGTRPIRRAGRRRFGISTDTQTPRNSLESPQRPSPITCPHEAPLNPVCRAKPLLAGDPQLETLSEPRRALPGKILSNLRPLIGAPPRSKILGNCFFPTRPPYCLRSEGSRK